MAVVTPFTATAVDESVVVPSPSCPYELFPQHWTEPLPTIAQLCTAPAAIAVAPPDSPETGTGVADETLVVPLPSWPNSLYPQHDTEPSPTSAHVCSPLAEIAVTFDRATTDDGAGTPSELALAVVVTPLPTCPYSSSPQQTRRCRPTRGERTCGRRRRRSP